MPARYVETSHPFDWWPMLVECPRCSNAATALPVGQRSRSVRLSCPTCAVSREGRFSDLRDGALVLEEGESGPRWLNLPTGTRQRWPRPKERIYPLWLRTDCCGGKTLWAANETHLDFLLDYVQAGLRERTRGLVKSWTPSWRLPTWIKDAKNRDEIVTQLTRLKDACRH
jgi:hypothetical protein